MNASKSNRGMSIVEIIVVLVIAIILFAIFAGVVKSRKAQLKNAYLNEARASVQEIVDKERMLFARTGDYYRTSASTGSYAPMGVELGKNRYYKEFTVEVETDTPYNNLSPKITVTVIPNDDALPPVVGVYERGSGGNSNDDVTITW